MYMTNGPKDQELSFKTQEKSRILNLNISDYRFQRKHLEKQIVDLAQN